MAAAAAEPEAGRAVRADHPQVVGSHPPVHRRRCPSRFRKSSTRSSSRATSASNSRAVRPLLPQAVVQLAHPPPSLPRRQRQPGHRVHPLLQRRASSVPPLSI